MGLDETTVYRYARAFTPSGVDQYLAHEQPGYWGLLTSAQLAGLCQQVNATRYTACRALQAWLLRTYRVAYSVSGLTDLLHRLGFTDKFTTPVPCQADTGAPADFLDELAVLEAHLERGEAVRYYADAAPPHPQPALHPRLVRRGPGAPPAHRQRPRAGQPQRRPQRLSPHAGCAR